MNKLIVRVILISIAVTLIVVLLLRNRLPFGKSNSSFSSESDRDITRIEFSESGKKLSLEKKGATWLINEKTEARKNGILFIIRILKEIKIKSPVSEEMFNSEIIEKGIEPVKIKVYDGNKLIKSFLVYKTSSNIYGNIMKIKERSKPFIVYVPGYDGNIGSAFTMSEWPRSDGQTGEPFRYFILIFNKLQESSFYPFIHEQGAYRMGLCSCCSVPFIFCMDSI